MSAEDRHARALVWLVMAHHNRTQHCWTWDRIYRTVCGPTGLTRAEVRAWIEVQP